MWSESAMLKESNRKAWGRGVVVVEEEPRGAAWDESCVAADRDPQTPGPPDPQRGRAADPITPADSLNVCTCGG